MRLKKSVPFVIAAAAAVFLHIKSDFNTNEDFRLVFLSG